MNVFPVTESTLSAAHLATFLQDTYQLGPDTHCKLFRTGMNHLYMVTDGQKKYVLRIYTFNWRTRLEVSEELRLLQHLKQKDIPVAYPIADQNGELVQEIQAPEGLRYAVLFSFAEGRKIARFSAETAYHIGVAVGSMHKATEGFALKRVTYDSQTLHINSLERIRMFFSAPSEEMDFVSQLSNYLVKMYEGMDASQFRRGALHLDIWFDNMHMNGENEITIFDFDFCGNGFLCYDISYFLYQLLNTNLEADDYKTKSESFLKGYETIVSIPENEKRMMPVMVLSVLLFYLGIQCDRYDTWSNIFLNEDHLKRYIASVKRWMTYHKIDIAG
jgi:Ser/Thr protein kinase RdoA (MazF antagonist)